MSSVHYLSIVAPPAQPTEAQPPADPRQVLFKQVFDGNKRVLLQALAAAGVSSILLCFNGNDGFREVVYFEARAGAALIDLPVAIVAISHLPGNASTPTAMVLPLYKAIQVVAFAVLDEEHDGWHRDYGAYGDLTVDVAAEHVGLAYNERRMTSDRSDHRY